LAQEIQVRSRIFSEEAHLFEEEMQALPGLLEKEDMTLFASTLPTIRTWLKSVLAVPE
jgi:hypothetical protein